MHAYVISLNDITSDRNSRLCSLLNKNGWIVHFVDAVNGSCLDAGKYFFLTRKYFDLTKRQLTPSELGCTLSHKKVYEEMLREGVSSALVLEDDVVLNDAAFSDLRKVVGLNLAAHGFVHLGGQEGLEANFKNLRGILINDDPKVFEVNPNDLCWLSRTVGYLISAGTARRILGLLNNHALLIDDFSYIRDNAGIANFYFSDIVAHPKDLSLSSIERERAVQEKVADDEGAGLLKRLANEIIKTLQYRKKIYLSRAQTKYSKILEAIGGEGITKR